MSTQPTLVAIDLGAESCRVSLLEWREGRPVITLVRRVANQPYDSGTGLRWDFERICDEIDIGLRECAERVGVPIDAIGVTGWAVDYVRLDAEGKPTSAPFCYRDARTREAMEAVHALVPESELYSIAGTQIQPINTIYQLYADKLAGIPASAPWVNLPEYMLHRLGAPRIAEYTNATHTGLIDLATRDWSGRLFKQLGLDRRAAPELVDTGTVLGPLRGTLTALAAFETTQLIAPACHDTASAVAGMPVVSDAPWAYLSSGTWSLLGTLLPAPLQTSSACARGFTNLGGAGGKILFHRGIPGMWLLRQCLNVWNQTRAWSLQELIAEARKLPAPGTLLDLGDPALALTGDMTVRINEQRVRCGLPPLSRAPEAAPYYANLIFHSLAGGYASLLDDLELLTGRRPEYLYVAGGGSRNEYLNALTASATGVPVHRCSVESATLGNLAIQWARLEQPHGILTSESIAARSAILAEAQID